MSVEHRRVAYFTDAYLEVDGVANTARQFEAWARRQQVPFLIVHGGYDREKVVRDGDLLRVELPRSRFGFALDRKHEFDLAFLRHLARVEKIIGEFSPDVLHITGPSDVGILGTLVAHRQKIPLVASWHTNVHQYAERRALPLLAALPGGWHKKLAARIREWSFLATSRFYKIPRVLMAPNRELIELLERSTHKPCFLMTRGVDTELFHPGRRDRSDRVFTIGYVGRITLEKNVLALIEIERCLREAGVTDYRFVVVGQGACEDSLRANLPNSEFPGVLMGEPLARAYANMDVFLFPSKTDTFGNVVLEAMASGVPALVSNEGGPQFIVRPGATGYVCDNNHAFARCIQELQRSPEDLETMRIESRKQAEGTSWDTVFAACYRAYEVALSSKASQGNNVRLKLGARAVAKT